LRHLPLRKEPIGDSTLVENFDGARVQTACARAEEVLAHAPLDNSSVHARQRQLARQHLRDTAGTQLASRDEGELFNIANSFAIRHHNPKQKTQYDSGVWLDWIFYSYLNSIELAKKLLKRGA
jgi:hypothetical protein